MSNITLLEQILIIGAIFTVILLSFLKYVISSVTTGKIKSIASENEGEKLISIMNAPLNLSFIINFLHNASLFATGSILFCILVNHHPMLPLTSPDIWIFLGTAFFLTVAETFLSQTIPFTADRIVLRMRGLYTAIYNISYPFFKMILFFINPFIPKESKEKAKLTEDDLLQMVEEASKQGVLEKEEKEMITSVFELSSTTAHEIMIPRLDIIAIEKNTSIPKVVDMALDHGYSRMPVYEGSIDKIVGIIHTKDLIAALRDRKMDTPLYKFTRKPLFIPNNKKIDEILRDMQASKMAMAIIIDEYGGTDGLVTMEDVIEEIVGDISDEYDEETQPIVREDDATFTADGKTSIEEVNKFTGCSIPEDEFETIGGYLCGLAGHIPSEGEEVEDKEASFKVEKITGNRIGSIKIRKLDAVNTEKNSDLVTGEKEEEVTVSEIKV